MTHTTNTKQPLAIHGGTPVRTEPMPKRRLYGDAERRAVMAVFDEADEKGATAFAYGGPHEQAYCDKFVQMLGGGYADGVNSGSNAVYLALRALEPEPFTEVIVPAISDPGGVAPVALCNCIPVPADTAPGEYNISAETIEQRLTKHTSAIIVAHIAGLPVDMDPIMELARSRNIPVIEDAAQAHGAAYKGRPIGTIGDIAAFSTMFGKHHATSSQGGIVYTRNEDLHWSARRYADRGKGINLEGNNGNVVASLNCNMDTLAAAVGCAQLDKLPDMVAHRRKLAHQLAEQCRTRLKHFRLVTERADDIGTYWFLFLNVAIDRLNVDKRTVAEALVAEGFSISASYHVVPAHMTWAQQRRAFGKTSALPWSHHPDGPIEDPVAAYPLPNAAAVDAQHIRGMFHESWTEREVDDLVAALTKIEAAFAT